MLAAHHSIRISDACPLLCFLLPPLKEVARLQQLVHLTAVDKMTQSKAGTTANYLCRNLPFPQLE
jgi:hypothetical protein